jgi:hypothetical protein
MSFSVQYIPLNKIKPDGSAKMTHNIKLIRKFIWDCMYLLAVEENPKEGNFIIVSGIQRYEYLRKHTNNKYTPCIVLNRKLSSEVKSLVDHLFPNMKAERITPASWSILRSFLQQEPRFINLSLGQQIKVLLLGIRYKKTVIQSMRALVDQLSRHK